MRAAILDIETTDLGAVGMGWITCAVVLPLEEGAEARIFRYDDYHCSLGRETKLVRALLNHLVQFDVLIGHNLYRFDFPYLKTRAEILGVTIPPFLPLYYDTYEGFRRSGLRTQPNFTGRPRGSLDHVWDLYFGRSRHANPKTRILPEESAAMIWEKGEARKEFIDRKVDHCARDCAMNAQIFPKVFRADPKACFKRF